MSLEEIVSAKNQLLRECEELGITISSEQADLLLKHLDLLIKKNAVLNLTRITDTADAVTLHLVDSLTLVKHIPPRAKTLCDIGTGGGFPGLPLAVATGLMTTLVDATRKKCVAVSEFVDALGIDNCRVVNARAEELALSHSREFDIVSSRAVSGGATVVEYAAPLLMVGGSLLLAKANISDDELAATEKAANLCGMEIVSRETFELPRSCGTRTVLAIKKTEEPKIALPRNVGMAQHHPLA